jgi:hypothetical protein
MATLASGHWIESANAAVATACNGHGITIEAWMSATISGNLDFFTVGNPGAGQVMAFFLASNTLTFELTDATGKGLELQCTSSLRDGVLHHLIAAWDGAAGLALFVDGVQLTGTTTVTTGWTGILNTDPEIIIMGGSGGFTLKNVAWYVGLIGVDEIIIHHKAAANFAGVACVAVMPGVNEDEVWAVVGRGGSCTIERMASRFQTDYFVDSGTLYEGVPVTTVSGLDHLDSLTVSVVADGVAQTPQVVTGGAITLAVAAGKIAVGIGYTYVVEPMRIDVPSRTGVSQGSNVRVAELVLSFLNSAGMQYGMDSSDLYDVPLGPTELIDDWPDLFTGQMSVCLDGGYDPEAHFIVTGIGTPCTLRSIVVRADKTGR